MMAAVATAMPVLRSLDDSGPMIEYLEGLKNRVTNKKIVDQEKLREHCRDLEKTFQENTDYYKVNTSIIQCWDVILRKIGYGQHLHLIDVIYRFTEHLSARARRDRMEHAANPLLYPNFENAKTKYLGYFVAGFDLFRNWIDYPMAQYFHFCVVDWLKRTIIYLNLDDGYFEELVFRCLKDVIHNVTLDDKMLRWLSKDGCQHSHRMKMLLFFSYSNVNVCLFFLRRVDILVATLRSTWESLNRKPTPLGIQQLQLLVNCINQGQFPEVLEFFRSNLIYDIFQLHRRTSRQDSYGSRDVETGRFLYAERMFLLMIIQAESLPQEPATALNTDRAIAANVWLAWYSYAMINGDVNHLVSNIWYYQGLTRRCLESSYRGAQYFGLLLVLYDLRFNQLSRISETEPFGHLIVQIKNEYEHNPLDRIHQMVNQIYMHLYKYGPEQLFLCLHRNIYVLI